MSFIKDLIETYAWEPDRCESCARHEARLEDMRFKILKLEKLVYELMIDKASGVQSTDRGPV